MFVLRLLPQHTLSSSRAASIFYSCTKERVV
jgi:hypothetical protein